MEPPKIRWHDEYYKWTQQFFFEAAKSQLNYLCLHDAVVYSCFAFGWIKQNSLIRHKKIVCLTLVIFLIKIYIYILKKLIVWVCFGFVLFCLFYLFLLQNTFPDDDGSVTEIKDADLNSSGSAVKVFSKFG